MIIQKYLNMAKKRIGIIGAAELGSLILRICSDNDLFEVVGFYDDFKKEAEFMGLPILGTSNSIVKDFESDRFDYVIIGFGYKHFQRRLDLFNLLSKKIPFANVIHPHAHIEPSAELGQGCVVFPGVVIDQAVVIGDNVVLNLGTSISHHSQIGDHCFLAPGVKIAGRVHVGHSNFIGIGAVVIDMVNIGDFCTIGALSLVLSDIGNGVKCYGIPVKEK